MVCVIASRQNSSPHMVASHPNLLPRGEKELGSPLPSSEDLDHCCRSLSPSHAVSPRHFPTRSIMHFIHHRIPWPLDDSLRRDVVDQLCLIINDEDVYV